MTILTSHILLAINCDEPPCKMRVVLRYNGIDSLEEVRSLATEAGFEERLGAILCAACTERYDKEQDEKLRNDYARRN